MQMELSTANRRLPTGVRFHPTDEELVMHYLKRKVHGQPLEPGFVAEVDIYQFHPADLRDLACFGKELIWYFFCTIGKKYGNGDRKNRSTQSGFWKPTGNPRPVRHRNRIVGKVKSLVFHEGKPAKGERTDWVMYEYRVEESELADGGVPDAIVLCKIFKKVGLGPSRNGEHYGAPYDEDEWVTEEENDALVTVAVQDQSASVVMNDSVSGNVSALGAPEQAYSGALSVSGVHQAPTPTDGVDDQAVDKMPDAIPKTAVDMASGSGVPAPKDFDGMLIADDFGIRFDYTFNTDSFEDLLFYLEDLERPLVP